MDIASMRERIIQRALEVPQTTPSWWDRDCRCCMELMRHKTPPVSSVDSYHNLFDYYKDRTGRGDYTTHGDDTIVMVEGEEVHADHTQEELLLFLSAERERQMKAGR